MTKKSLPFTKSQMKKILAKYPTPFHIYDEKGIRHSAQKLKNAFQWVDGFTNYFAVKALPNPYILEILKEEGFGADCSSLPELMLAEKVGLHGEQIMFTSNNTAFEEYQYAKKLGAIINLDDITHISYLEKYAGIPETICFRYNPGPLRKNKGNALIGKPEEAKYGMTKMQLFKGFDIMKKKGVKKFGLHTMIASNELSNNAFIETAQMLFDLVRDLYQKIGIRFTFINLGGGIGIPYRPEENEVDLQKISREIKKLYNEKVKKSEMHPLKIVMECGRFITGPNGYLVMKAIHEKNTYKKYIGVDACMANLMRPGMYGAYHHITVLGKENDQLSHVYDIVGSLCENNDKLAINRALPNIEMGDILVQHDTGAHGHAMGFNYNGKLRSAELLQKESGNVQLIRRAESVDDYFRTLDFTGVRRKI